MAAMPAGCCAIDHIVVRTTQPGAAAPHALLAGMFGLPVVWPVTHEAFGTYGWISLGNTSLEIWGAAANGDLPPG